MIPSKLSAYRTKAPLLNEAQEWSLLRKWALSEVYRIKTGHNQSRVIKWGGNEMAREAAVYTELVHPLEIKAPQIFEIHHMKDSVVIIMEDAGRLDLEKQIEPQYFIEAARELARLRAKATINLQKFLSSKAIETYTVSKADFLQMLDDLVVSDQLSEKRFLHNLKPVLSDHLDTLYERVPTTLVHADYHAKNLMIQKDGIMPIDWSHAYLSPHLGDLYCLINEADHCSNLSSEDLLSAFLEESNVNMEDLNWQMQIGGLCWLLKTLRWLVNGGTDTIPGSEAWVPNLAQDMENIYRQLV